MNESTPQLNQALAKAKSQFDQVLASKKVDFKTNSGRQVKFKYAEHDEIAEAVTPALSANGLAIASQMLMIGDRFMLVTTLRHESGESLPSYFPLPKEVGSDPKEFGTIVSYGRRYNTICLLEITTVDPSNETERAEQVRKLAKDIKTEAGLIKKPEPIQKLGAYKPTGNSPGYKPQPQPQAESQENGGLYPRNNKTICVLLRSLNFAQSRFDSWINQKFPGRAVDMLDSNEMQVVIKTICKTYASDHNNVGAIQAIDAAILAHLNSGADFQVVLDRWLTQHFSNARQETYAKV